MVLAILVAVSAEPFVDTGKVKSFNAKGILEVDFGDKTGKLPVDAGAALFVKDEKSKLQKIGLDSKLTVVGSVFGTPRKGKPQRLVPSLIVCLMPGAPRTQVETRAVRTGVVKKLKPLQFEAGGQLYNLITSLSTPVVTRWRAKFPEFKEGTKVWVKGEKAPIRTGKRKERRDGVKAKELLLLAPGVSDFRYRPLLRPPKKPRRGR